MINHIIN